MNKPIRYFISTFILFISIICFITIRSSGLSSWHKNKILNLFLSESELQARCQSERGIDRQTSDNNLIFNLSDIKLDYSCCYRDVNEPITNIGRPFPYSNLVKTTVEEYLSSKEVLPSEKYLHLRYYPESMRGQGLKKSWIIFRPKNGR